jgi:hypothetical protein
MSRIRRIRWIVLTAVLAVVVATLAVGANAYADQSGSRCAQHAASASGAPPSWRVVAFRSVGCRAWRHMHHHRSLYRAGH